MLLLAVLVPFILRFMASTWPKPEALFGMVELTLRWASRALRAAF